MNRRLYIIRTSEDARRIGDMIAGADIVSPLQVDVKPYKKKRSVDQNALYWVRIGEIARHIRETTGKSFSSDDIHAFFVDKYLDKRIIEMAGEVKTVPRSTTSLSVMEFTDYLELIAQYCAEELNLVLSQ
jgi:NinB protein